MCVYVCVCVYVYVQSQPRLLARVVKIIREFHSSRLNWSRDRVTVHLVRDEIKQR